MAQGGGFSVDHPGSGVRGELRLDVLQHRLGQHIACGGSAVAQDAVEQQVVRHPVANAQQGAGKPVCRRLARFKVPHKGSKGCKADRLADAPVLIERGIAQGAEAETATALPTYVFADATLFSRDDLLQTRDAVRASVIAHFDADVAASHFLGDCGCGA